LRNPDTYLDELSGGRGWRVTPQAVDELVDRDRPVDVQREHREQAALLLGAELKRSAVRNDLDGTEQPDLHGATLLACPKGEQTRALPG
jgi:hypothetical protein